MKKFISSVQRKDSACISFDLSRCYVSREKYRSGKLSRGIDWMDSYEANAYVGNVSRGK
jgi:hypothetical protein